MAENNRAGTAYKHTHEVETQTGQELIESNRNISVHKRYIWTAELARDLVGCLDEELRWSRHRNERRADRKLVDAVFESVRLRLPNLLREFALKVGHGEYSDPNEHLEIMCFVHQYREAIVNQYIRMWSERDPERKRDEENPRTASRVSNEVTCQERVDLLGSLQDGDTEHTEERDRQDALLLASPDDTEEEADEALGTYRRVVHDKDTYGWLKSRLSREVLLEFGTQDYMDDISEIILNTSPSKYGSSSRRPPEGHKMILRLDWDLQSLSERFQGLWAKDRIPLALTLTGSWEGIQGLSCLEYLRQTWPDTGEDILLTLVEFACDKRRAAHQRDLSDGTQLTVRIHRSSSLVVETFGIACSLVEVAQVLAWLGCAFHTHQSRDRSSIALCTLSRIEASEYRATADYAWDIGFRIYEERDDCDRSSSQCWLDLFSRRVVARGFPVLRRPDHSTGLELPLEAIAKLTQATHATVFCDKIFMKGYGTMLVLARSLGNVMVWHLLSNEDGTPLSYSDPRVAKICPSGIRSVKLSDIPIARHIIDWSKSARNCIGAPDANYSIGDSSPDAPRESYRLKDLRIYHGRSIAREYVNNIEILGDSRRRQPDGYVDRIRNATERFVIFYDTNDRAWLTDGASALLYLVRASLKADRDHPIFGRLQTFQMIESTLDDSASEKDRAVDVLTNPENLQQPLMYTSHNYFKNRVQSIWCHLDLAFEYQVLIDSKHGSHHGYLEGYDFKGFFPREHQRSSKQETLQIHTTKLHSSGKAWPRPARQLHAITLFGKDFGDLSQTMEVPDDWPRVPMGKGYYLAALINVLRGALRAKIAKPSSDSEQCLSEDRKDETGVVSDSQILLVESSSSASQPKGTSGLSAMPAKSHSLRDTSASPSSMLTDNNNGDHQRSRHRSGHDQTESWLTWSAKRLVFAILIVWCILMLSPIHMFIPTKWDLWPRPTDHPTFEASEILHQPDQTIIADVFAIQGPSSDPINAWRYAGNESDIYWLRDILPKHEGLENIRVIQLNHEDMRGLHSPEADFDVYAKVLLDDIDHLHQKDRPIIFIAHGFGGLLLKRSLFLAQYRGDSQVPEMTKGIMFLGVPHHGTKRALIASILACTTHWRSWRTATPEYMLVDYPAAARLDESFAHVYGPWSGTFTGRSPPYICNFRETRDDWISQLSLDSTVAVKSEWLPYVTNVFLDTNHRELNKFRSFDDPNLAIFLHYFRRALGGDGTKPFDQ